MQRVGAKDSEFDAAFLEECEEVSFVNVGGSLRAKVHTPQATFLTPISARAHSKTGNKPWQPLCYRMISHSIYCK